MENRARLSWTPCSSWAHHPRATTLAWLGSLAALIGEVALGCVPSGNSTPRIGDGGAAPPIASSTARPSTNVMTTPFSDAFDRPGTDGGMPQRIDGSATDLTRDARDASGAAVAKDALPDGVISRTPPVAVAPSEEPNALGPDWHAVNPAAWVIENGRLCGRGARNKGVWLKRTLPVNARIEFDAVAATDEGDLKAELWGDGTSAATSVSYDNATSYLVILGGWKNTLHVLARIDEHGRDRKEISADPASDDLVRRPVQKDKLYHFIVERTDGRTVRWFVDGAEVHTYVDPQPLTGMGHDHFGFNNWNAKTCFDNVRVTPL